MIKVAVSKQDGVAVSIDGTGRELVNETLLIINGIYTALDEPTRGAFKRLVTHCVNLKEGPVWQVPGNVEVIREKGV